MNSFITLCLFAPLFFNEIGFSVSRNAHDNIDSPFHLMDLDLEQRDEELSKELDGMLKSPFEIEIDTFAWNIHRINAGRFDYKTMDDTVIIPLVDSAQKRFYVHPFKNYVTSPFGPRRMFWHYGVDIKLSRSDSVQAAFDGIVRVIQNDRRGYGNVVVVRHHFGLETIYAHLSRVLVTPNQRINAGDVVGMGGSTGRSTGTHLHFEMRYYGEPFDPGLIIDFENYSLKNDTLVLKRDHFEYLTELRKTVWHTVRRGETLSGIALRYRTSVAAICRNNGISSQSILRIGQRLVVRKDGAPSQEVYLIRNTQHPHM